MSEITKAISARQTRITQLQRESATLQRAASIVGPPARAAAKPKPKLTKVQVTSEGFKPTKHHADGRGFPHFYKETYFL